MQKLEPARATASWRERKKALIRTTVRSKALELFAEKGFAATSVADIAQASGVSERTFFRYFPTKEDVVFAYRHDLVAVASTAIDETPAAASPGEVVVRVAHAIACHIESNRDQMREVFRLVDATPSLSERRAMYVNEAANALIPLLSERCRTAEAARLFAVITTAAVATACRSWSSQGGAAPLPRIVSALLDEVVAGLTDLDG